MKRLAVTAPLLLVVAALMFWPQIELWLALRGGGTNPENPSIVMLGDSHTEFVNWPLLLHCKSIANHGVGGNDTAQMLARLPEVIAQRPRLVVLMAGTNDARRYVSPAETIANLRAIKQRITDRGIEYVSLTPPPLPSRGDSINASIGAAMLQVPFTVDDLRPDQIHLRRSGYAKWRDAIAPMVQKYC
jgi:lysophospholipase L1-like esterase